jgi:hypothetical protein
VNFRPLPPCHATHRYLHPMETIIQSSKFMWGREWIILIYPTPTILQSKFLHYIPSYLIYRPSHFLRKHFQTFIFSAFLIHFCLTRWVVVLPDVSKIKALFSWIQERNCCSHPRHWSIRMWISTKGWRTIITHALPLLPDDTFSLTVLCGNQTDASCALFTSTMRLFPRRNVY